MARIGLILTPGFADWEHAFIAVTAPFYGTDVRLFAPAPGQLHLRSVRSSRAIFSDHCSGSMLAAEHG